MTAVDPHSLEHWTAAELAHAGDALGVAWHRWPDRPIDGSVRAVLEASRAYIGTLGPVELTPPRPVRAIAAGRVGGDGRRMPRLDFRVSFESQVIAATAEPVLRLDERGLPYWERLPLDPKRVDLALLNGGDAPVQFRHDPSRIVGRVMRAWINIADETLVARIAWRAGCAEADRLRDEVEHLHGACGVSVGVIGWNHHEVAPRLVEAERWTALEISLTGEPAMAGTGLGGHPQPAG